MAVLLLAWPVSASQTTLDAAADDSRPRTIEDPYVAAVALAADGFLEQLTEEQRQEVQFPFDDRGRTRGRETDNTPSFCAILAWCKGWGLSYCSLSFDQRVALNRLLSAALSDSGYQTFRAVWNRNRLIGELEEHGDNSYVGAVAQQCPELTAKNVFDVPENCQPQSNGDNPYITIGGDLPPDPDGKHQTAWQLSGPAPGIAGRHKQFCEYTIAIFGEPGSDAWALRVEGHHITINLTYEWNQQNGRFDINATPLFIGSFPIVTPPAPDPDQLDEQLSWQDGQMFMAGPVEHVIRFISLLPDEVRETAFTNRWQAVQSAPLYRNVPPPWLVSSLEPQPPADASKTTSVAVGTLDKAAKWHLQQLFYRYFDTMPADVADRYRKQLNGLLGNADEQLDILWAGENPPQTGQNVFIQIRAGSLLVELVANNQWSTQHPRVQTANHMHSMLRDLAFHWDYDLRRKSAADHH